MESFHKCCVEWSWCTLGWEIDLPDPAFLACSVDSHEVGHRISPRVVPTIPKEPLRGSYEEFENFFFLRRNFQNDLAGLVNSLISWLSRIADSSLIGHDFHVNCILQRLPLLFSEFLILLLFLGIGRGSDLLLGATPVQSGQQVTANRVNSAILPEPGGSKTWHERHEAMNARAKQGHVNLIYIGDSIVGNWKWDGKPVWDYYYGDRNGLILGISGDRTQQALWRLQHGNIEGISPKLAIVMIGQNNGPFNTGEEIGEGIAAVVKILREKLPATKVLVLGIFPRGEKPNPERLVLARANQVASKLADGKSVFFMDITPLFLRADGSIPATLMPDYEHPNEEGCRVWANAIESKVAELMGDKPKTEMESKIKLK